MSKDVHGQRDNDALAWAVLTDEDNVPRQQSPRAGDSRPRTTFTRVKPGLLDWLTGDSEVLTFVVMFLAIGLFGEVLFNGNFGLGAIMMLGIVPIIIGLLD